MRKEKGEDKGSAELYAGQRAGRKGEQEMGKEFCIGSVLLGEGEHTQGEG